MSVTPQAPVPRPLLIGLAAAAACGVGFWLYNRYRTQDGDAPYDDKDPNQDNNSSGSSSTDSKSASSQSGSEPAFVDGKPVMPPLPTPLPSTAVDAKVNPAPPIPNTGAAGDVAKHGIAAELAQVLQGQQGQAASPASPASPAPAQGDAKQDAQQDAQQDDSKTPYSDATGALFVFLTGEHWLDEAAWRSLWSKHNVEDAAAWLRQSGVSVLTSVQQRLAKEPANLAGCRRRWLVVCRYAGISQEEASALSEKK